MPSPASSTFMQVHLHHERDGYDDREKEIRDRDPREKKLLLDRDVFKERNIERERELDDRRGRFQDADYARNRDVIVRSGREYEDDRDYFPRPAVIGSREVSLDRPFDDPYDRYNDVRYEGSGRSKHEDIHPDRRGSTGEYSPINEARKTDERRSIKTPSSLDPRFSEDRRKSGSSLERSHHEAWDERKATGSASIMDRLQDKPDLHHYSHQPQHQGSLHRGDWIEPVSGSSRGHNALQWSKKKRRGPGDWSEEYPLEGESREWGDDPEWGHDSRHPPIGQHEKGWVPPHQRVRYGGGGSWSESERREDWAPSTSIQDRLGTRAPPMLPPVHSANRESLGPPQRRNIVRKETVPDPDSSDKTSPKIVTETLARPDGEVLPPAVIPKRPASDVPTEQSPAKTPRFVEGSPANPSNPVPAPAVIATSEVPSLEKDNFSDFSDDPDDILNQDAPEVAEVVKQEVGEVVEEVKAVEPPSYEDMLEEEERMDLEEISDEELEEEKQAKFSVTDALDINWSALISDVSLNPAPTQGSALKRFRPLHILSRLGVSTKYARPEVLQSVTDACLRIEAEKASASGMAKVKTEEEKEVNGNDAVKIKVEVEENGNHDTIGTSNLENKESLPEIHPVVASGGVVRYLRQQSMNRSRLFGVGRHRRALCAREDLALRRRLCNLPDHDLIGSNVHFDKQLFREAVNLLKSH